MKQIFKNKSGFTLVELLVVVAIIGMLSSLATVSLNSARTKARDSKRFADVRQLQLAVELCFQEGGSYPLLGAMGTLPLDYECGPLETLPALSSFLGIQPLDPSTYQPYSYCSLDESNIAAGCTDSAGTSYQIEFTLEDGSGTLPAGTHCVIPAGVLVGPC
ncbi:MAG: prepilin-type N-terminal cleavage/methylation domain-containing protein [bacterium]|nr:prepilin-type N-terminal cleavage/methylation domain-containing protein [bacterium]